MRFPVGCLLLGRGHLLELHAADRTAPRTNLVDIGVHRTDELLSRLFVLRDPSRHGVPAPGNHEGGRCKHEHDRRDNVDAM